jgi:glycine hydroxymethyltransferase
MRPVSGGTDTHLALLDLRDVGVTGREAEERCDSVRITLNKNAIPYDPQKPMIASGVRVGTPSVTTQGMREGEMHEIAALIAAAVRADPATTAGATVLRDTEREVSSLVSKFPAYGRAEVFS